MSAITDGVEPYLARMEALKIEREKAIAEAEALLRETLPHVLKDTRWAIVKLQLDVLLAELVPETPSPDAGAGVLLQASLQRAKLEEFGQKWRELVQLGCSELIEIARTTACVVQVCVREGSPTLRLKITSVKPEMVRPCLDRLGVAVDLRAWVKASLQRELRRTDDALQSLEDQRTELLAHLRALEAEEPPAAPEPPDLSQTVVE